MRSEYQILCLLKAVAPITHMQGVEGNEAVIMREPVTLDGTTQWVPVLTGNALRHSMVREPGWIDLLKRYGLMGHLTLQQFNFLLHGGALTKGTKAADLKRSAAGRRLLPLFSILGGSLDDEIVSGWLDVGRGALACLENQRRIIDLWAEAGSDLADVIGGGGKHLLPAESFVSPYQYTRGDAKKWLPESSEGGESNLMIFSGQQVNPGAIFLTRLRLRECSEIEAGALLNAIELWSGVIGGQRSRGHGQLHLSYRVTRSGDDVEAQPLVDAYLSHAATNRDEAVAWLYGVFDAAVPQEVMSAAS